MYKQLLLAAALTLAVTPLHAANQTKTCEDTKNFMNTMEAKGEIALKEAQAFIPSLTYIGPHDTLNKLHRDDAIKYYNLGSVVYQNMFTVLTTANDWEANCTDASPEKLAEDKEERNNDLKRFKHGMDLIPVN
jgi:hypothetical protein